MILRLTAISMTAERATAMPRAVVPDKGSPDRLEDPVLIAA